MNQDRMLPDVMNDPVEQAGRTAEAAAADLQRDRREELAATAEEGELLQEQARVADHLAHAREVKAAAHEKVVRDEKAITDAIAHVRDEPAPGPTPPPQPPRPRVG